MRPLAALLLVSLAAAAAVAQPAPAPAPLAPPVFAARPLTERAILLDFRARIENWDEVSRARSLMGWAQCTPGQGGCTNVCAWMGVTCGGPDGNHVTKLDLSCTGSCTVKLRGPINPNLAYLDYLQELDLAQNELNGPLPELWGMNNTFLSLVELNLNDNQLSGPIPASWGVEPSFNALANMQIASNRLNGTVPTPFCVSETSYKELMSMNFNNNQLTGPIPPYINGLITMEYVSFAGNMLTGRLPPDWGQQAFVFVGQDTNATQALAVVLLNDNLLSGPLPREWAANGSMTVLRTLALQNNRFSGGLPEMWAALPALETLMASNTGLSGPLPQWGPGPATLKTLDISYNNFSGPIPASWAALPNMAKLVLQPGNEGLCAQAPPGATFSLCSAESPLCSSFDVNTTACPSGSSSSNVGGGSGGSSFPVAAVAVPCAVLGAAALAGGFLFWRRRRCASEAAAQAQVQEVDTKGGDLLWLDQSGLHPTSGSGSGARTGSTSNGLHKGDLDLDLASVPCDWKLSPDELEFLKRPDGSPWQLGSGGFGVVMKARCNGAQPVAVKVLRPTTDVTGRLSDADFAREISILRACRDANILQFVGCFVREEEGEQQLCLVTEFCEGGSLQANLRQRRVSWWRHGRRIALDVARALAYLHAKRLVHLDVKSSNVLLSRAGTAKLGDLGMAKLLVENYVTGTVGTLAWSAPEMLMGQRCSERADIYSYGVVLWEICTGELPARGLMRDPRCPEECPKEVDDLINRCMNFEVAERPTAVEIVKILEAMAPGPPPAGAPPRGGAPQPPRRSPFVAAQAAQVAASAAVAAQAAQAARGEGFGNGLSALDHDLPHRPNGSAGSRDLERGGSSSLWSWPSTSVSPTAAADHPSHLPMVAEGAAEVSVVVEGLDSPFAALALATAPSS